MKINEALNKIMEAFKDGNIPQAVSLAMHPSIGVPQDEWSLFNRTLCFLNGTGDARGFKQWKQVDRYVTKGSKSFQILAPSFKKVKDEETEEDKQILRGFVPVNVFRAEDTDGKELDYESIKLPDLPFIKVAEKWGLSVKGVSGQYSYYGYYSHGKQEIALATPEETIFFHELAHASDYRVRKIKPKGGQQVDNEIIAELSACVLAYMVGKKLPDTLGNHYRYIERYAKKEGMNTVTACMKFITNVEMVVNEILKAEESE